MQPAALKIPQKMLPDMADKNFQGRTKIFNAITENFYPNKKIFRGTIFFLTSHTSKKFIG